MLPKIDFNVVDLETTRYKRTHNTSVQETEELLKKCYGDDCWRVILCNSGQEALNTAVSLIQPKTVIVDDETYFELRFNLQYHKDWIGYKYIQLKDLDNLADLDKALQNAEKPILVCGDHPTTFGNWKQVKKISEVVHQYGGYVMMDNSIVSFYYSNPLNLGADIVVESYTKYVTGQGDTFAGGIAFSHSMEWLDEKEVPATVPGMKSIMWIVSRRGNVAHPLAAYNVAKGLETLDVRMPEHTWNARRVFTFLKSLGLDVKYSGLGGLITLFGVKPDFCKYFKHFVTCGTFGCVYSNADFFRSDTYYTAGVCTRLSIGLEFPWVLCSDIISAFSSAFGYSVSLMEKNRDRVFSGDIPTCDFDFLYSQFPGSNISVVTGADICNSFNFTGNLFDNSASSANKEIHFMEGGKDK